MDEFINNDFIKTIWKDDKVLIRTISSLNIESTLDKYVEKFINLRTFLYVNTTYGKVLSDSFESLDNKNKIQVKAIIESYLHEIDLNERKWFLTLNDTELLSMGFSQGEIDSTDKEDLYKEIKGGYYCEILLSNILLSLGYELIISKLYFQYGLLSPTGIDVPFINLKEKRLILGECKLYKNLKSAIDSCYKDLSKIYDGDKFYRDYKEWMKKITSTNESFADYVTLNELNKPEEFLKSINEIVCLGFVIGNEIELEALKTYLKNIDDFAKRDKIQILLITIPIESKDKFVECCYNALKKIGDSINDR